MEGPHARLRLGRRLGNALKPSVVPAWGRWRSTDFAAIEGEGGGGGRGAVSYGASGARWQPLSL